LPVSAEPFRAWWGAWISGHLVAPKHNNEMYMSDLIIAHFRIDEEIDTGVESWRKAQDKIPQKSDAFRQLLRRGIAASRAERKAAKTAA
jgi:hypothetical protein